ncbi:hypothetical protein P5P86_06610 [Nocardioides sp. BP30]|uniref:hypothetical protein n=1 Tax=Nocardioides sp. BP30 TaxID=3036374 RepID=UPI00246994E2|nr:hypothetical protein [Nocardioides sp. BP30]WGL53500.1 hypothetical protein P5P86_06610 [Nocardioides sp. BP30]
MESTSFVESVRPVDGQVVELLDAQLRAAVRQEAVDPQRDLGVVRRLAEAVVRAHDERSLTGAVQPVGDPAAVVAELVARLSGFGPLQPYLDDAEVEEVWINDPSRVFVARRGRHELTNLVLDPQQVTDLVERMLKASGRHLDRSTPFVDATMPGGIACTWCWTASRVASRRSTSASSRCAPRGWRTWSRSAASPPRLPPSWRPACVRG